MTPLFVSHAANAPCRPCGRGGVSPPAFPGKGLKRAICASARRARKARGSRTCFYDELGAKSPFFRTWFGDWRANDQTPVKVTHANGNTFQNGAFVNEDTGWTISVGSTLRKETAVHEKQDAITMRILNDVEGIIHNAVLLETDTPHQSKSKMPNTAFMHSFYAPVDYGGQMYIAKLFVEEAMGNKTTDVFRRAYELRRIEIQQMPTSGAQSGVLSASGVLTTGTDVDALTIAELFNLVKQNDPKFKSGDSSKVTNADGTPRLVQGIATGTDANGFMLYASGKSAEGAEGYLNIRNPMLLNTQEGETPQEYYERNADAIRERFIKGDYDGIIIEGETETDTLYLAKQPEQFKRSDNRGTFDANDARSQYSYVGKAEDGKDIYVSNFPPNTPKTE